MQEVKILRLEFMNIKTGFSEILMIVSVLLFLAGCQKSSFRETAVLTGDSLPVQEFHGNTTIYKFEEEHKAWELETQYIAKFQITERTLIIPVDLVIYSKEEGSNSTLIADTGMANKNMDVMEAMGNVVARSNDGKVLETDYIKWDKISNRITSDKFVKLVTEKGDVMTGIGFESDASLNHWKIHDNFKAVFKDVKGRVNQRGGRRR
jgi:LPS export ABC transporter protein LptC